MKKEVTVEQVNDYVNDILGVEDICPLERMPLETRDQWVRLIYIILFSQSPKSCYSLEGKRGETVANSVLKDNDAWQIFLDEEYFESDWERPACSWKESIKWLVKHTAKWEDRKKEELKKGDELKQSIRDLERNQVLNSESPTMKLKNILHEHLHPGNGKGPVPVQVLCEAIEIRDRQWQNAIEGYLHTQKFALLVPPGYFDQALSIYERYKFTHSLENVGLVNTEKLLEEARQPLKGSLAEEITAKEYYIQAYANWLLGGVTKCASEKELKHYQRAITATCMLYQNYTARQIPKKRYEVPYIGKQAVKVQLAGKQEELQQCQRELDLLVEKIRAA